MSSKTIDFVLYSLRDFESPSVVAPIVECLLRAPLGFRVTHFGRDDANRRIGSADEIVRVVTGPPGRSGPRLGGALLRSGSACEYQIQWAKMASPSFSLVIGSMSREPLATQATRLGALEDLVRQLTQVVDPVYGEIRDMSTLHAGAPIDLKTRLPEIPAVSIYGEPYVRLFGEECVRGAPFRSITLLDRHHYWLRASVSVIEPVDAVAGAAIREHFGEDAFMSGGRRLYRTGRAPQFDMTELQP